MECKVVLKAENGKICQIIEYSNGERVVLPLEINGNIRWFDDERLRKK